jgi:hypothetical protein
LAAGGAPAILRVMSLLDHDFVLASLARERIDRALAESTRDRLAREARRPPATTAAAPAADPALTPARLETR